MLRGIVLALLLGAAAVAQTGGAAPPITSAPPTQAASSAAQTGSGGTPSAPPTQAATNPSADPTAQMRADLNQMESLMNNMSSEVTFLRDQNLQILLNTNVRMWTILIRDLRMQLDEQERQRAPSRAPSPQ